MIRRQQAARAYLASLTKADTDAAPRPKRIVATRRARRDLLRAGVDFDHPPAPLEQQRIAAILAERMHLDLRWGCTSTLDGLQGVSIDRPYALISEWQWAGRGRQGRRWQSPLSGNYYIALAARAQGRPAALPTLPLLLGVALAEQLRDLGVPAQLKWPNDIVVEGRKLGGLLVELSHSGSGLRAHIGAGINWRLPPAARAQIDRAATDLTELCPRLPDRSALLARLCLAMLDALDALADGHGAQWLARWRQLDSLYGQRLQVRQAGALVEGIADSVDGCGRLRLQTTQGPRLLDAAEVLRVVRTDGTTLGTMSDGMG